MRNVVMILVCGLLVSGLLAISSEPVYIRNPEGTKAVSSALQNVRSELKTLKSDPEVKKVLAGLESALGNLQQKCGALKGKPVDVTNEYRGIAGSRDKLKPLLREHVLLSKLDTLLQKIEVAGK